MRSEAMLIDAFVRELPHHDAPFGPGDDCAIWPPTRHSLCVTSDALVEGEHFTFPLFSWADVGHKAMAANLSDLAAMGATPRYWLASLGLPRDVTRKRMQQLARGMAPLARTSGLMLSGGNLTASPQLTVTLTLAGEAEKPLLRSGAKKGDLVFVAGKLGHAAAGLDLARRGQMRHPLLKAQRRPQPQLAMGCIAARFATAAMDISDGLLKDAQRFAEASDVCVWIDEFPLSPTLKRFGRERSIEYTYTGGEDYCLLFTLPPKRLAEFEAACRKQKLPLPLNIGRVTEGSGLDIMGRTPPKQTGFDHFSDEP